MFQPHTSAFPPGRSLADALLAETQELRWRKCSVDTHHQVLLCREARMGGDGRLFCKMAPTLYLFIIMSFNCVVLFNVLFLRQGLTV